MCFLTDSTCCEVEDLIQDVKAFVRPGTNLSRSSIRHTHHFHDVRGDAVVVIHIGTNDVAGGVTPRQLVARTMALMQRIQEASGLMML